jgi:hypothetical protein
VLTSDPEFSGIVFVSVTIVHPSSFMKHQSLQSRIIRLRTVASFVSVFLLLMLFSSPSLAQSNAADSKEKTPRLISYQAMLQQNGGLVADGNYSIIVSLYGEPEGVTKVWHDTYNTRITGGLVNLNLGSGGTPLPSSSQIDRQL